MLNGSERKQLEALAMPSQVVLPCAGGCGSKVVAACLRVTQQTILKLCNRFVGQRLDGQLESSCLEASRTTDDAIVVRNSETYQSSHYYAANGPDSARAMQIRNHSHGASPQTTSWPASNASVREFLAQNVSSYLQSTVRAIRIVQWTNL